ncbi:MAG: dihydropteroate synthase [Pseudomonadota bacterium]
MALIERLKAAHAEYAPLIMGVVNVTPDSFSDGGRFDDVDAALDQAMKLVADGADILDIGGESTRPGAAPVSVEDEIQRVIPVIRALRHRTDCPISIDTSKPEVMTAAVQAGSNLINDVNGLRAPGAMTAAAESRVPVCLMHMLGEPRTMQQNPFYDNVVDEVIEFLNQRIDACLEAGMQRGQLIIDPGFGFGKTLDHNIALLNGISSLRESGAPVLAGLSRKSMLGAITGRESTDDRLAASLAAALLAAQAGAAILRVHDVAETVDVVKVWMATRAARRQ